MKRTLFGIFAGLLLVSQAQAQFDLPEGLLPVPGILRNSVTNLHAEGDALWVGPFLNMTPDGGRTWLVADVDSLAARRLSVYSLDVEGDVVWAGVGSSRREDGETVNSVAGYVFFTGFQPHPAGSEMFHWRPPHLDDPDDTTEEYGVSVLPALPVIVPEQSPPFDIDYDPVREEVWVAAWASGVRRSRDHGHTWDRVVLPPDFLHAIHPDSSHDFSVSPVSRDGVDGHLNHRGFSVLAAEDGTIWAGTAGGLNRSSDGLAWRRFVADGTAWSLTGNWVTSIEEQPLPGGQNPIWMATWPVNDPDQFGPPENYGVTVTRDGGETFEQALIGERVHDFAFQGARTVYVAGENGLFVTRDAGVTWRTIRHFRDAGNPDRIVRPDLSAYAVALTSNALWVGTSDGLMKSEDGGDTWRIYRTDVPLHPDTPTEDRPDADTYAYPNPFSPASDRFVRIRYDSDAAAGRIRIFDFRMHLVRELTANAGAGGEREVAWDGTDRNGFRVANGVYFYTVMGENPAYGKIQVLE